MSVFEDDATIDKHIQLLHAAGITADTNYPHTACLSTHNCWGLTAYLLGWSKTSKPVWINYEEMIKHLNTKSQRIQRSAALPGDIVVFGWNRMFKDVTVTLSHTALLTDTSKDNSDNWCYIHKPGELSPEVQTLDGVDSWHSYCSPTHIQQFRHPI